MPIAPGERRLASRLRTAPIPGLPFYPCAGVGIGSLPHRDPAQAVDLVVAHTPDLPALPDLPAATGVDMIGQWLRHVPGIRQVGGTWQVDLAAFDPDVDPDLDDPVHAGLHPFLHRIVGRVSPVKIQLPGPVTLSAPLVEGGVPRTEAIAAAEVIARRAAVALADRTQAAVPGAPVLVMIDEPGLVACAHPSYPLRRRRVRAALATVVDALDAAGVVTGIHCCGPTDWRTVVGAGPDVVSLPVGAFSADDVGPLARFIRRGGWVVWGVVPTDGPLGDGSERLWARYVESRDLVARAGVDAHLVAFRSLLSPECGLARHTPEQAGHVFEVLSELTRRSRAELASFGPLLLEDGDAADREGDLPPG